jgi:hypothetical protein
LKKNSIRGNVNRGGKVGQVDQVGSLEMRKSEVTEVGVMVVAS